MAFLAHHPGVVLTGDKGGQVGVWHVEDPSTYRVHADMNGWHTSAIRAIDSAVTGFKAACCASDGTVKVGER